MISFDFGVISGKLNKKAVPARVGTAFFYLNII